jgi:protein gp37
MGKNSKIGWTHHTWNFLWGCTKVDEECRFCYAESLSKRYGHNVWGIQAPRRVMSENYWRDPLAWNEAARKVGERHRVFCSSMADVFEDHMTNNAERPKLWELIRATPHLDWLLLTKRPQNVLVMLPDDWGDGYANVWLGTSVGRNESMARAYELAKVPAAIRFLSCEPMIGPMDPPLWYCCNCMGFRGAHLVNNDKDMGCNECECYVTRVWANRTPGPPLAPDRRSFHWVIFGGESGGVNTVRKMDIEWLRSGIDQCRRAGVPVFVKQMGTVLAKEMGLQHPKGEDPTEWPENLQIQEFPVPARVSCACCP